LKTELAPERINSFHKGLRGKLYAHQFDRPSLTPGIYYWSSLIGDHRWWRSALSRTLLVLLPTGAGCSHVTRQPQLPHLRVNRGPGSLLRVGPL